jgi:hypothetical protein
MEDKPSFNDATRIAGELFGNLFGRDSDEPGFDYALKTLLSGRNTARTLVREFVTSEEFRELHLMNQTPNEFARRALLRLLGNKRPEPVRVKEVATSILEGDWRKVVAGMIDSPDYYAIYGDYGVPVWV